MKWKLCCIFSLVFVLSAKGAFAQRSIPIGGTLNIAEKKLSIEFNEKEQGSIRLDIKKNSKTEYDLILSVTHWKIKTFDLSTVMTGSLDITSDENGKPLITAQLASKYMLLNYQPVTEAFIDFSVHGQQVDFHSFRFGPFWGDGNIALANRPQLDLEIHFSDLKLADAFHFLHRDSSIEVGGNVDGDVGIKGSINHLKLRGRLNSFNGFVGPHDYNVAQIYFEGIYPKIFIDDSYIAQTDGLSFALKGALDLSDLKNIEQQFGGFVKSALVKESGQNLEWTFKRLQSEENGGATEFKYMLRKDNNDEENGMIGIERRLEF